MQKVDIIMGVYNDGKTLQRALDSILRQMLTDWRLLVCDDGSTDDTQSILEEYRSKAPEKIALFSNGRNRGLTYCLNRLIGETRAAYTARMDGDDICFPQRLQKQVNFLDTHPQYAIVASSIQKFDEEGVFATVHFPEKPTKEDLLWNSPFVHPTVMMRTDVLKELGGYRDIPKTVRCEDYDLWFRAYALGHRGYCIQEPLLRYYEGRQTYGKRKYRYRINEARTRLEGYRRNGMLVKGLLFVLKPLLVGLIPKQALMRIRRQKVDGREGMPSGEDRKAR